MKYVVTCFAGIISGAASYELSERFQWTIPGQRALVWATSLVAAAFACASLWA